MPLNFSARSENLTRSALVGRLGELLRKIGPDLESASKAHVERVSSSPFLRNPIFDNEISDLSSVSMFPRTLNEEPNFWFQGMDLPPYRPLVTPYREKGEKDPGTLNPGTQLAVLRILRIEKD
ncbi:predicted protein [Histoplasma mississippiense (nom. inval.)]|uniref:predicted protein n=1 Tax=Ajellomyces capsulatus (strain NAm1 / WU24) TaxID=2059318 RepID=UPI000157D5F2|nr:predicted protein [Histoplasma mississippiense (nom. inval.)]EDN05056.1 predicted protein [Histoplasma mississippiense (nom. inval.)]